MSTESEAERRAHVEAVERAFQEMDYLITRLCHVAGAGDAEALELKKARDNLPANKLPHLLVELRRLMLLVESPEDRSRAQ